MEPIVITTTSEDQTTQLGKDIAMVLKAGDFLCLSGDLGAGKSVLARGVIRHLANDENFEVPSPTYTLCEPYEAGGWQIMHLDLYRLGDPEELEYIGVRELDSAGTLAIVEWPDNGAGWLPKPALILVFDDRGQLPGRQLRINAVSAAGGRWLQNVAESATIAHYM